MNKILIIACIWIVCFVIGVADAVRVQVNAVPAIVTSLTTTSLVKVQGPFRFDQADPGIVYDVTTGGDTDFWHGVTEDAGGDNDDFFQFGTGTTLGASAFLQFDSSGNIAIGKGTKHDGYVIRNAAEVQTTDATVTVLDNVTLLDENTYHFKAIVIGVQSDGTDRAAYHIEATVYRTGAGGATLQGEPTSVHTQESNASLAATFTVNSNDIRVSVTGIAAETWEWGTTMKYMNMSN